MIFQKKFQGTLIQYFDTDQLASANPKRFQITKQEFVTTQEPLFCFQDGTPVDQGFFDKHQAEVPNLITWLRSEEDIPKWAQMFEIADDLDVLIEAIPKDDWAIIVAKLPSLVRQRIVTTYKELRKRS